MTTTQFINKNKFPLEEFKLIQTTSKRFAPQFFVSNFGRVIKGAGIEGKHTGITFSLPKFATLHSHSGGYVVLNLKINGKKVSRFLHRLVAEAFMPCGEAGMQVNHINGDKTDNHASNLEWVTPIQNIRHAIRTGLNGKTKIVVNLETGIFYVSAKEASDSHSINYSTLRQYLNGRAKNKTSLTYLT